jgi:hypothetical protein
MQKVGELRSVERPVPRLRGILRIRIVRKRVGGRLLSLRGFTCLPLGDTGSFGVRRACSPFLELTVSKAWKAREARAISPIKASCGMNEGDEG